MAEKLIKTFTVGADTGKVDYDEGIGGNKPNIPLIDARIDLVANKAELLEDFVAPELYTTGYPKVTFTVAEGMTGFAVKKGNQPDEGEPARKDLPDFGRGYVVGYHKEGTGYAPIAGEASQFNAVVKPSTAEKAVMASAEGTFGNCKVTLMDETTGESWISITKLASNITVAIAEGTPFTATGTSTVSGVTVTDNDDHDLSGGLKFAKESNFVFKVAHEGIPMTTFTISGTINGSPATVGTEVEDPTTSTNDIVMTNNGNKKATFQINSEKITGDVVITVSSIA